MAVDFSLLPAEEKPHEASPSKLLWAIVFLTMALIGVFVVLFFWPKDLPTQTWKFWVSIVLFPVGIPLLFVLRRYSIHEGRKADVELLNEAVRSFNDRVFHAASIPLAILGTAFRFSADEKENTVQGIQGGAVKLKTQDPIARTGEPVKARWLAPPGVKLTAGSPEDDRRRSREVTQWLFDELLDDLSAHLSHIPARIPLTVRLAVANGFTREENELLWQSCWRARSLRHADLAEPSDMHPDLMMLDAWLDETIQDAGLHATLVVAVQLHPLLCDTPPAGTSEAGAALLLLPVALAQAQKLPTLAYLHRPVRAALDAPADALSHAMRWADADAAHISAIWQSSRVEAKRDAWKEPARTLGLTASDATHLDQTVGEARIAAPWITTACAAESLKSNPATLMVLVGNETAFDCAVLRCASAPDSDDNLSRKAESAPRADAA